MISMHNIYANTYTWQNYWRSLKVQFRWAITSHKRRTKWKKTGIWKRKAPKREMRAEAVEIPNKKENVNESNDGGGIGALIWYDKHSWHIHRRKTFYNIMLYVSQLVCRMRNLDIYFSVWLLTHCSAIVATHLLGKPIWLLCPCLSTQVSNIYMQCVYKYIYLRKMREIHLFSALSICLSLGGN